MGDHLRDILLGVDFQKLERDGYERQVRGEDAVILAHLHCLPSIQQFFSTLMRDDLAIPGRQIILIPKAYSTIASVEANLRRMGLTVLTNSSPFKPGRYDNFASVSLQSGCRSAVSVCREIMKKGRKPRLVLVDDGGLLTETWWRHYATAGVEVVSVQQTASGVTRKSLPSEIGKIDVARSAAKRQFESSIIAAGVLKKVSDLDVLKVSKRVGIVGVGALGGALAADLSRRGRCVNLYDLKRDYPRPRTSVRYPKLSVFLNDCDLVFGCTGRNFLLADQFQKIKLGHSLHFVSCSSRDVEFLDLLRLGQIKRETIGDGFGRLEVSFRGAKPHFVENGGFPVNFDRRTEQETPDEIALTRALVLAGVFQALCVKVKERHENFLMLSPTIQQVLVHQWLELTRKSATDFGVTADIGSLDWWKDHSVWRGASVETSRFRG